jgi:hypothetical protein
MLKVVSTFNDTDLNPRVVIIPDGSSVTINADTTDLAIQTNTQAAGTLTMNAPTGTPANGQRFIFRLQSTNQQTLAYQAFLRVAVNTITWDSCGTLVQAHGSY